MLNDYANILVLPIIFMLFIMITGIANADEVEIKKAVFRDIGVGWNIAITLKHSDSGWKHYADAWRIVDSKGTVIAKRTLYHPHVKEQPFTRSLNNIKIPVTEKFVYIEAHDTISKWSSKKLKIDLFNNVLENVTVIR